MKQYGAIARFASSSCSHAKRSGSRFSRMNVDAEMTNGDLVTVIAI
jgi:hypothetical protein